MDYASWSEKMITKLVSKGLEEEWVRKSFEGGDAEIRAAYENQELNSAGAVFVKKLEKYDLDLELAWQRGQGRLDSDLAASYQIPKEEARQRFIQGSMKKTKILGWFRGEDVDLSASLNF
ncbi:hypothetical protein [Pseudomonas lactucae]|uniref:Uncharacterized protein n=1 Tax=Pseudomonas lactucae TaxID=2813360 RepID=A0A9X0YA85_9PSED|nr:hypothetical protein [Pseudomonas lactucae]MBN2976393.1 hypothetical protein [Pseudomonas lactucae]MBN2987392.1 hypothetical protein [Pseudomonas lactucae]